MYCRKRGIEAGSDFHHDEPPRHGGAKQKVDEEVLYLRMSFSKNPVVGYSLWYVALLEIDLGSHCLPVLQRVRYRITQCIGNWDCFTCMKVAELTVILRPDAIEPCVLDDRYQDLYLALMVCGKPGAAQVHW